MGNVIGSISDPELDISQRYEAAQSDQTLSGKWWLTDNET